MALIRARANRTGSRLAHGTRAKHLLPGVHHAVTHAWAASKAREPLTLDRAHDARSTSSEGREREVDARSIRAVAFVSFVRRFSGLPNHNRPQLRQAELL